MKDKVLPKGYQMSIGISTSIILLNAWHLEFVEHGVSPHSFRKSEVFII
jgi:hypothetical protein